MVASGSLRALRPGAQPHSAPTCILQHHGGTSAHAEKIPCRSSSCRPNAAQHTRWLCVLQTNVCGIMGSAHQATGPSFCPSRGMDSHISQVQGQPLQIWTDTSGGGWRACEYGDTLPGEGLFKVSSSAKRFQTRLANGTSRSSRRAGCTRWLCCGGIGPKMLQTMRHYPGFWGRREV